MLGLWFAGSRAGLITLPVVIGMALVFGAALRPLLTALVITLTIIAGIRLASSGSAFLVANDVRSTREHMDTIWQGISIFLAHPMIGAGFGRLYR